MSFLTEIFEVGWKYRELFLEGTLGTLELAFITVLLGSLLGTLVSILKMSKFKLISAPASFYIGIIRGTPMLVQLYIFYLFVPEMSPAIKALDLPVYFYITLSLVINSSAYIAEIIRSGIQAVDKGQTEAAKSLGMSNFNVMIRIIMPQAIKNILPAVGNEFIAIVKETSMASTFFIGDLMTSYLKVNGQTYLALEILIIVGTIYLAVTFILSKIVLAYERRLNSK